MRFALVVLMFATGCSLYHVDGDDDACLPHDIAPQVLRNPETGQCEEFDVSCPVGCACPDRTSIALPDWGHCNFRCDTLDESSCLAAPGCRAAYLGGRIAGDRPAFHGCWATPSSGPIQGACTRLDAQECSRHDDCVGVYIPGADDSGMQFGFCRDEPPGACSNIECQPGNHCEEACTRSDPPICHPVCVPDRDLCALVDCVDGTSCVVICGEPGPGGEPGTCHAECKPDRSCETAASEAECAALGACTAVYRGTDCTCDMTGACECEVLTYDRCETP